MYESYFGLSAKPFQLNPDPAFFFGSRGHKRAMAYLEYGLHQSEGFIVITGEIGAGKTTLVRSLLEGLDARKVVAAQLVSTHLDASDVLRAVSAAFGVPCKNLEKAELLLALETFLVSITASGKRALLIVDEAQNLTPEAVEELRMLSNFQLEDHALLQSFLVGQPEFREIMQSTQMQQLRQRVIASYHLGPLDSLETRGYVEHRLAHVGWKKDPAFDSAAFSAIYRYSGGIPRRINTLCDRVLLAVFLAGRHNVQEADVTEVVAEVAEEQAAPKPVVVPLSRPLEGVGASAPGFDIATVDGVSEELASALSALSGSVDVQQIEARLAQLERSVSAMARLLDQLVRGAKSSGERQQGRKDA
jgi:putative secretion ATPase (PEP-CTERM system associated)